MKILLIVVALFAIAILTLVMGGIYATVINMIFPDTMNKLLLWIGWEGAPWQFGVALGFIAGFFRTTVSTKGE